MAKPICDGQAVHPRIDYQPMCKSSVCHATLWIGGAMRAPELERSNRDTLKSNVYPRVPPQMSVRWGGILSVASTEGTEESSPERPPKVIDIG